MEPKHMIGVKAQTHESDGSQFLAEIGQWLSSQAIKTISWKLVFRELLVTVPVRWDDDSCGRLLVKQHTAEWTVWEGCPSHIQVPIPCSPEMNIRTVGLDLTQKHLNHLFSVQLCFLTQTFHPKQTKREHEINDLERERGLYREWHGGNNMRLINY